MNIKQNKTISSKMFKLKTFLSIITTLIIIILQNQAYAQTNKILFKVDNEIITSFDILNEVKYLIAINEELKKSEEIEIYEIAKRSLIRQKIKAIEINKKYENFKIEEDVLKSILLNYFKRININSYNELTSFFKKNNIDEIFVKNRITLDAVWNELILSNFSNKVKINEHDIKKELLNRTMVNEFLLREILFNVDSNESLDEKIDKIKQSIKNKGFVETALTLSISNSADSGGKLDWVKETSLNKKIRKIINNIEIGDHTSPIIVPGGFLILKLENKKSTKIELDLDKEIKLITQKKTAEQLNQYSTIYFNKIKKDIKIYEF